MNKRTKVVAVGATGLAVIAAGTGLAVAGGATEDMGETDTPISGSALDQAGAAALDHTGQGKVTETEVGDEQSYYEVEVTLDDGTETDVQLDRSFNVVGSESDANDSETNGD